MNEISVVTPYHLLPSSSASDMPYSRATLWLPCKLPCEAVCVWTVWRLQSEMWPNGCLLIDEEGTFHARNISFNPV
jgi:hypothetical protein